MSAATVMTPPGTPPESVGRHHRRRPAHDSGSDRVGGSAGLDGPRRDGGRRHPGRRAGPAGRPAQGLPRGAGAGPRLRPPGRPGSRRVGGLEVPDFQEGRHRRRHGRRGDHLRHRPVRPRPRAAPPADRPACRIPATCPVSGRRRRTSSAKPSSTTPTATGPRPGDHRATPPEPQERQRRVLLRRQDLPRDGQDGGGQKLPADGAVLRPGQRRGPPGAGQALFQRGILRQGGRAVPRSGPPGAGQPGGPLAAGQGIRAPRRQGKRPQDGRPVRAEFPLRPVPGRGGRDAGGPQPNHRRPDGRPPPARPRAASPATPAAAPRRRPPRLRRHPTSTSRWTGPPSPSPGWWPASTS